MVSTYSRKPSLDDARARVARASEHIARLEGEVGDIWLRGAQRNSAVVAPPNMVAGEIEDSTHTDTIVGGAQQPVPPIIPILVSEAAYNLRAALDYLVFELSVLDSGKGQERSQFPIESSPNNWKQRLGDWLSKLNGPHQAAIKLLQPFDGCQWTAVLRDISNPDKHRHLTIIDPKLAGAVTHLRAKVIDGRLIFAIQAVSDSVNQAMDVKAHGLLFADAESPKDRLLVIETLHLLQKQVADVIEAFDPDFQ